MRILAVPMVLHIETDESAPDIIDTLNEGAEGSLRGFGARTHR